MIHIALIGIIAVLLAIQLKTLKSEYGIYLTVAACFIIFFYAVNKLSSILESINRMMSYVNINSTYVTALLKMIGITYISEFSSNICKDAGYQAISNQIEVFAKLMILAISMPILLALMETINEFFTSF